MKNVFVKSIHPYAYKRKNEYPIVSGLYMYKPDGLDERMCYEVRYLSDMFVDFIPLSEFKNGNFELFSK